MENTKDTMKECMKEDNIQKKKIIQILMSTYNGEKYLKEQLDSFINLENFEYIKVLIRDDGSTDSTLEILHEYRDLHGFEIIEGTNVGVNKSIAILFERSDKDCEFFAISDQDDVWLKDKFTKATKFLNKEYTDKPLLFASCSEVVDENLNHIGGTLVPKKRVSFYNAMVQNVTPGHTQVFNRKLMEKLIGIETKNIHVIDWWIYLLATAFGEVFFINDFTVKHRQHGKNAVGYQLNFFKKTVNRIKSLNKNDANSISKQLYAFQKKYGDLLKEDYKKELNNYFDSQKTIFKRMRYVFQTRTYRQSYLETVIFKCLYLFGKYRISKC